MSTPVDGLPAYDLAAWRAQIPLLERFIPLNNCSQAPQTARTAGAARQYLESWNRHGMDWDAWIEEVENARSTFARLIGASPHEVAVTSSVSSAVAALASALDFGGSRGRVLASAAEFPGVGHVWSAHKKHGAVLDWVPVRSERTFTEDYEARIDERTLIVSASHAWYQNGFIQDIPAIAGLAHDSGALIFVDAYQSAGVVPIDVREMDVDFLASGTLKYLLGVPGIAFLYVRSEIIGRLEPTLTGWFGRRDPFAFDVQTLDWSDAARRFDAGTPPVFNAYVSHAGMTMISEIGVPAIREWTLRLTARLLEGIRSHELDVHGPVDPKSRTSSTAVRCGARPSHEVEAALRKRGVIASARGGVIRLAPHFYNTLEEMDRAVDALASVLKKSKS